ncbi:hypothetical protein LGK95_14345 [Clostridium algoriphilum]|uniref:hypothetical protein n=1 Tax=Clostridium algoriphilum TaxID=198347 RepID=UPI001CF16943|nr:hypothetical protein [Clostridium algoriphilum]MCB2294679.1 hypothetical protein [Clostridium algoriphilum]
MIKEKLLYEQYLKLQSKEWKEEIIGYKYLKRLERMYASKVHLHGVGLECL